MLFLNDKSEEAFQEGNERNLESVRSSSNLDGDELIDAVNSSTETWTEIVEDMGSIDQGGYLDFSGWYKGNGDIMDPEYIDPIAEQIYEEVLATNSSL